MKAMKKKIFTRATFLVLVAMMMLMPLAISAFATDNAIIADDCCVVIGDEPVVTMSSGVCPLYCSHEWVNPAPTCSTCKNTFAKKTCDGSSTCGICK